MPSPDRPYIDITTPDLIAARTYHLREYQHAASDDDELQQLIHRRVIVEITAELDARDVDDSTTTDDSDDDSCPACEAADRAANAWLDERGGTTIRYE